LENSKGKRAELEKILGIHITDKQHSELHQKCFSEKKPALRSRREREFMEATLLSIASAEEQRGCGWQ
jgi:hypothetical protein